MEPGLLKLGRHGERTTVCNSAPMSSQNCLLSKNKHGWAWCSIQPSVFIRPRKLGSVAVWVSHTCTSSIVVCKHHTCLRVLWEASTSKLDWTTKLIKCLKHIQHTKFDNSKTQLDSVLEHRPATPFVIQLNRFHRPVYSPKSNGWAWCPIQPLIFMGLWTMANLVVWMFHTCTYLIFSVLDIFVN